MIIPSLDALSSKLLITAYINFTLFLLLGSSGSNNDEHKSKNVRSNMEIQAMYVQRNTEGR